MKKIALFAVAAAFAANVNANEAANELLLQLDVDQDGVISQEEGAAVEGLSDQWATLDINADGSLDEAEFAQFEVVEGGLMQKIEGAVEGAVDGAKELVEGAVDAAKSE